ncbi:MAG: dTMP kinase [Candidatus Hydrogenedentes bacterium]|nr:dTMP kinase [Candidatus Hydrogenedentota bacterium]
MKCLFITLEGIEGCGKSTQLRLLREHLAARGFDVITTREPGGTPAAEAVRAILLDPAHKALSSTAEALLYAAARAQHVDELIAPALEAGKIVLSDRFADSTTAYQGAGRAVFMETIQALHSIATRGTWPDLTIILDLPAAEGLKRAAAGGAPDRIEQEPLAFHERVREEFLRIARAEPDRITVVDASRPVEAVSREIREIVDKRVGLR